MNGDSPHLCRAVDRDAGVLHELGIWLLLPHPETSTPARIAIPISVCVQYGSPLRNGACVGSGFIIARLFFVYRLRQSSRTLDSPGGGGLSGPAERFALAS